MADRIANPQNFRGKFVAEDLRIGSTGIEMRLFRGHDGTGDVFVQVGAANAAAMHPDDDVVGTGFGIRQGFERERLARVEVELQQVGDELRQWLQQGDGTCVLAPAGCPGGV